MGASYFSAAVLKICKLRNEKQTSERHIHTHIHKHVTFIYTYACYTLLSTYTDTYATENKPTHKNMGIYIRRNI
jgi:hypothetical protein